MKNIITDLKTLEINHGFTFYPEDFSDFEEKMDWEEFKKKFDCRLYEDGSVDTMDGHQMCESLGISIDLNK